MTDEWASVRVDDLVQALVDLYDNMDNVLVAKKGSLGRVVDKEEGCLPTVRWEHSGRALDAEPGEEFEVMAEKGFASTPETTPRKARREALRRGVS